MKKATFTVETISAGMGEVLVYVEDPAGHREEVMQWLFQVSPVFTVFFVTFFFCAHGIVHLKNPKIFQAKVTANNDKNRTYSVYYIPKVTGMHKVSSD